MKTISITINDQLKESATKVANELGMTLHEAIVVMLNNFVNENNFDHAKSDTGAVSSYPNTTSLYASETATPLRKGQCVQKGIPCLFADSLGVCTCSACQKSIIAESLFTLG